jgi:hypothetical protein
MGACRSARPACIGGHWGFADYCSCLPVGWAMALSRICGAFAVGDRAAHSHTMPAHVATRCAVRPRGFAPIMTCNHPLPRDKVRFAGEPVPVVGAETIG